MKIVISKDESKMINKKLAELNSGIMAGLMMGAVNCLQSDDAIFERLCLKAQSSSEMLLGFKISYTETELTLELIPEFMCDLLEIYGSIAVALFGLASQAGNQFKMLKEKWENK